MCIILTARKLMCILCVCLLDNVCYDMVCVSYDIQILQYVDLLIDLNHPYGHSRFSEGLQIQNRLVSNKRGHLSSKVFQSIKTYRQITYSFFFLCSKQISKPLFCINNSYVMPQEENYRTLMAESVGVFFFSEVTPYTI